MSRLPEGALARLADDLQKYPMGDVQSSAAQLSQRSLRLIANAELPFRRIPIIKREEKVVFRELWPRKLPVLVHESTLPGDWTPERFIQTHGQEVVTVLDGQSTKRTSLSQFLQSFVKDGTDGRILKLKVLCTVSLMRTG